MDRRLLCASVLAGTMWVAVPALLGQTATDTGTSGTSGAVGQPSQTDTSGQTSSQTVLPSANQQSMVSETDKLFIKGAAENNMAKAKFAQLALQKSQNAEVRNLAQQVLQDQQKADEQIQKLSQKTGVQTPQQLSQMCQDELNALSQLQGDDFDKQFVSIAKTAHAAEASKCSDVSKIAKNEDVKQFAAQQIPTIQKQGEMVMACAAAQGLSTDGLQQQAQPAGTTITPSTPTTPEQQGTYRPHHDTNSQQTVPDTSK